MTPKSARKPAPPPPTISPAVGKPVESPPIADQPLNFHANIGFWRGRRLSLIAALEGVAYTVRTQPNAWIEITALGVVAIAGLWFRISAIEWGLLGLTVAVILALECVNTAIESVVDLISPHYHPLAKVAKDTAAGALIIAVLGSVAVAAAIFLPRLWQMVQQW